MADESEFKSQRTADSTVGGVILKQKRDLEYEMRKGILNWYPFTKEEKTLYIGRATDSVCELLVESELSCVIEDVSEIMDPIFLEKHSREFHYIVVIQKLETAVSPVSFLQNIRTLLTKNGTLLLASDNRIGLRYICGDKDPFSGQSFDGLEYYRSLTEDQRRKMTGRCYSKAEVLDFVKEAGFMYVNSYSVLPDISAPQLIYAEDVQPNEDISGRLFPRYNDPSNVFLQEEYIWKDVIKNGLLHKLANSFLFECSMKKITSHIGSVTISMDRGKENALSTVIRSNGEVVKHALYPEGQDKLNKMIANNKDLNAHGIATIDARLENGLYIMDYCDAPTGSAYLQRLLETDITLFLEKLDEFHQLILDSSEHVANDPLKGVILKLGYIDMVPLNSFYKDGRFVFFDQEFTQENYPANAIMFRAISIIYGGEQQREQIFPMKEAFERYGLNAQFTLWLEMSLQFTDALRNREDLREYRYKHEADLVRIRENRKNLAFGVETYQKLFGNPFYDIAGKRLFVFGSGRFAEKYIAMYEYDYHIEAVFDNNQEKWGSYFHGYAVMSPDMLRELNPADYKVIICVKDFMPILQQLRDMGAQNIGVYDKYYVYPGRQAMCIPRTYCDNGEEKPYHIGYCAGVYDLYHIGHVNIFRRAKELCDYLIVGVVSDEGVREFKHTEPYIPFAERIDLVRSCRFVDEAVKIPVYYNWTIEAFQKYHFDCQFSGDDYENEDYWLNARDYLRANGSDMVFFPYTPQTSSTKLKGLIDRGAV